MKKKAQEIFDDEPDTVEEPMPTIIAPVRVPTELTTSLTNCVQMAKANKIVTQDDLQKTATIRNQIAEGIKQADALFEGDDKPKTLAYRAWKSICDLHNALTKGPKEALELLNGQMRTFNMEQERRRLEAQREAQRKIDEDFRKQQEALLAKAEKAKKPETKQKYEEQAAQIVAPQVIAQEAPKVEGVSFRKKWKAAITDEAALFDYICANKRRDLIVGFNQKVLDALAASLKEQAQIPGVRFFEDQTVATAR